MLSIAEVVMGSSSDLSRFESTKRALSIALGSHAVNLQVPRFHAGHIALQAVNSVLTRLVSFVIVCELVIKDWANCI